MMSITGNTQLQSHKFIGGAALQKELQGYAGFVAYQESFRKGTSSTKATMEKSLRDQYFGISSKDDDFIGLAEQLVQGVGVFAGLYKKREEHPECDSFMPMVTDVHTSRASQPKLILKPELHCFGEDKRIVVGATNGIHIALLYSRILNIRHSTSVGAFVVNATSRLANRTIHNCAQEFLKNRKALSIVLAAGSPYKAYAHNGTLPSGMALEDYYVYIRKKMYILLKSSSVDIDDDSPATTSESFGDSGNDPAAAAAEDAMPNEWVFPGFFLFALMGPIVPFEMLAYRSELLMTTPSQTPPGTASLPSSSNSLSLSGEQGRNAAWKIAASAAGQTKKRCLKVEAPPPEEMVTLHHRIQVAAIAQSRIATLGKEEARRNEGILANHRQKVKDMKTLISNKRFLISITDVSDPNRAMYIEEFKTMNTNLSVLMSEAATAEDVIINKNEQEVLEKNQMHYNFIDLTIAAVVADKHDTDDWGRQTTKKGKHDHEKNCLPTTAATAAASLEVTTFI